LSTASEHSADQGSARSAKQPRAIGTDSDPTLPPLSVLSVVIPARDEADNIASVVEHIHVELRLAEIPHEIVVVDDGSTDGTWQVLEKLAKKIDELVPTRNEGLHGFGRAVVHGFDRATGDAVVIMMGDHSDDPRDVVAYWRKLSEGYDCVFGSRFLAHGGTLDYPRFKLALNRIVNWVIRRSYRIELNDTTNAFKAYRREVIDGCRPILSPHFNLTIELPLKAIVRGYTWTSIPITWRNRQKGAPKLLLREMGSRYFLIYMYVLLEKYFSRGDYHRDVQRQQPSRAPDEEPGAR
jgi:dolichol-phosphate mannosyltransferase